MLVERWILARLRHRTFFSLAELNAAIAGRLPALNQRPFQGRSESRQSLFEALDRPAPRPLPATAYVHADGRKSRPLDTTDACDQRPVRRLRRCGLRASPWNGGGCSAGSRPRIAECSSASEKNVRCRNRARIQRSTSSTAASAFALSLGL